MASIRVMHDLGCACGRHFRRPLYHALDAAEQPGLRYALLAGVLNAVQCPACERTAVVGLPFLYGDEARGHLFQVYPDGEGPDGPGESDGGGGVRMIAGGRDPRAAEGARGPAVMAGVAPLLGLIEAGLGEDEQPGSLVFDVRPGIASERLARHVAGQVAAEVSGYVHSWREGGRLHIDVLGPAERLESIQVVTE